MPAASERRPVSKNSQRTRRYNGPLQRAYGPEILQPIERKREDRRRLHELHAVASVIRGRQNGASPAAEPRPVERPRERRESRTRPSARSGDSGDDSESESARWLNGQRAASKQDNSRSLPLTDLAFAGKVSRPASPAPSTKATCKRCTSSLAGRRQERCRRTIAGTTFDIDIYVCGCGKRREIRREVRS